jgi:hypothetical protein
MSVFEPVAAISTEHISVIWTSGWPPGMEVEDPSEYPGTARFAFPPTSGDQNHPAGPDAWFGGTWLPTRAAGYLAQCLVGPGGVVQLAPGTYDVWCELPDPAGPVRRFAGQLPVY